MTTFPQLPAKIRNQIYTELLTTKIQTVSGFSGHQNYYSDSRSHTFLISILKANS